MEKLSLQQFIRYVLIGFVLIGVCYICSPDKVSEVCKSIGTVGISFVALVIGTTSYLAYRSILYGLLILRLIDLIHTNNVRSILMKKYNITKWYEAETFWRIFQEIELQERSQNRELGSAGTHLLYMTSIATLVGSTYLLLVYGFTIRSILMLISSTICFVSAVVSDYYLETIETLLLKSIDTKIIDKFADKLGFKKKIEQQ